VTIHGDPRWQAVTIHAVIVGLLFLFALGIAATRPRKIALWPIPILVAITVALHPIWTFKPVPLVDCLVVQEEPNPNPIFLTGVGDPALCLARVAQIDESRAIGVLIWAISGG